MQFNTRSIIPLCLSGFFIFLAYSLKAQSKKVERSCPDIFVMHKGGGDQKLRYASNHALNKADTAIKTLLIYIHGINRNGLDYFEYADDMIGAEKKKKETLLIAPQYADAGDLDYYQLNNDFLYWKKAEWKDGYASLSTDNRPQNNRMSSYEVLDSLLTAVLNSKLFPNISMVVIAGHSAGGQFVQRYSAITPLPDRLTASKFRFIAMDPSSYMYPDGKRPAADGSFIIPDTSGCPDYNRYPKGLTGLNTYAKAMGAENIRHNMLQRDIVILLGQKDTRMNDPNLDVSCAANLQGPYRLVRGLNYTGYISTFAEYGNKQNYGVVPDSGHNGDKMINSDLAKKWIFGN